VVVSYASGVVAQHLHSVRDVSNKPPACYIMIMIIVIIILLFVNHRPFAGRFSLATISQVFLPKSALI